MYRVSYQYRDRRGTWQSAVASFNYVSETTAEAELAQRHGVSEASIRIKSIDQYESMSDLNDLLRG